KELDAHLTAISLQKEPTARGKQWVVTLIKGGANSEVMTANGKRVIDNIRVNWSRANSKAFTNLVSAATFKSAANKSEKTPSKNVFDDKWNNAVLAFYKARGNAQKPNDPN
ncbi:MAG: hypothetical protein ACI8WM_002528, partial [Burkholderiaceae bacterium]